MFLIWVCFQFTDIFWAVFDAGVFSVYRHVLGCFSCQGVLSLQACSEHFSCQCVHNLLTCPRLYLMPRCLQFSGGQLHHSGLLSSGSQWSWPAVGSGGLVVQRLHPGSATAWKRLGAAVHAGWPGHPQQLPQLPWLFRHCACRSVCGSLPSLFFHSVRFFPLYIILHSAWHCNGRFSWTHLIQWDLLFTTRENIQETLKERNKQRKRTTGAGMTAMIPMPTEVPMIFYWQLTVMVSSATEVLTWPTQRRWLDCHGINPTKVLMWLSWYQWPQRCWCDCHDIKSTKVLTWLSRYRWPQRCWFDCYGITSTEVLTWLSWYQPHRGVNVTVTEVFTWLSWYQSMQRCWHDCHGTNPTDVIVSTSTDCYCIIPPLRCWHDCHGINPTEVLTWLSLYQLHKGVDVTVMVSTPQKCWHDCHGINSTEVLTWLSWYQLHRVVDVTVMVSAPQRCWRDCHGINSTEVLTWLSWYQLHRGVDVTVMVSTPQKCWRDCHGISSTEVLTWLSWYQLHRGVDVTVMVSMPSCTFVVSMSIMVLTPVQVPRRACRTKRLWSHARAMTWAGWPPLRTIRLWPTAQRHWRRLRSACAAGSNRSNRSDFVTLHVYSAKFECVGSSV